MGNRRTMWKEQTVMLDGPVGPLEMRLAQSEESAANPSKPAEILGFVMCHPHPLKGGAMDNKVVTTMTRTANRFGLPSLRFNFRGVGESAGEHDHGIGEQDDLATVIQYAQTELGWQRIVLGGFSFGCGVACLYSKAHPAMFDGLFLVAPAVSLFDAPSTVPFDFETHVYMGDVDEVVAFEEVEHWAHTLTPQPYFRVFEGAGHFFHGRLTDLKTAFTDDLQQLQALHL